MAKKSGVQKMWDEANSNPNWENHIKTMTNDSISLWGFDKKGNMYFNGKKIQYTKKIELTGLQLFIAGVAASGTIATAFAHWYRIICLGI